MTALNVNTCLLQDIHLYVFVASVRYLLNDDPVGIGTPHHLAAGTTTDRFTFSERLRTIASAYERRQLIDYHSNVVMCSYLAR